MRGRGGAVPRGKATFRSVFERRRHVAADGWKNDNIPGRNSVLNLGTFNL